MKKCMWICFVLVLMVVTFIACGGGGSSDGSGDQVNNSNSETLESENDNTVVTGEFSGSATVDVWYGEPLQPQKRTYILDTTIIIDEPLIDDDGFIENNPFNLCVVNDASEPGSVAVLTANLYNFDEDNDGIDDYRGLIQTWDLSGGNGNYSGFYNPGIKYQGVAWLNVEQLVFEGTPISAPLFSGYMPIGTPINIIFDENQIVITITGNGLESEYQGTAYVEKFEITIIADI